MSILGASLQLSSANGITALKSEKSAKKPKLFSFLDSVLIPLKLNCSFFASLP